MTATMRWRLVRPVRPRPRPPGVWWARCGALSADGYGGGLCGDGGHPVVAAERGEPNRKGEREGFWVCAVCTPVGGEGEEG